MKGPIKNIPSLVHIRPDVENATRHFLNRRAFSSLTYMRHSASDEWTQTLCVHNVINNHRNKWVALSLPQTKAFLIMMTSSNGNISALLAFVRGIHRSPVNSPHKGQRRGTLMFSLIWPWINGWVNSGEAGDLRRHCAHQDVTLMDKLDSSHCEVYIMSSKCVSCINVALLCSVQYLVIHWTNWWRYPTV